MKICHPRFHVIFKKLRQILWRKSINLHFNIWLHIVSNMCPSFNLQRYNEEWKTNLQNKNCPLFTPPEQPTSKKSYRRRLGNTFPNIPVAYTLYSLKINLCLSEYDKNKIAQASPLAPAFSFAQYRMRCWSNWVMTITPDSCSCWNTKYTPAQQCLVLLFFIQSAHLLLEFKIAFQKRNKETTFTIPALLATIALQLLSWLLSTWLNSYVYKHI